MLKVVGRKGCTSCLITKKTLVKNKVEFEYIDLDLLSEKEKNNYIEKAKEYGTMSLPFIIKDDVFVDLKEAVDSVR